MDMLDVVAGSSNSDPVENPGLDMTVVARFVKDKAAAEGFGEDGH
jgi:hypothetical protein